MSLLGTTASFAVLDGPLETPSDLPKITIRGTLKSNSPEDLKEKGQAQPATDATQTAYSVNPPGFNLSGILRNEEELAQQGPFRQLLSEESDEKPRFVPLVPVKMPDESEESSAGFLKDLQDMEAAHQKKFAEMMGERHRQEHKELMQKEKKSKELEDLLAAQQLRNEELEKARLEEETARMIREAKSVREAVEEDKRRAEQAEQAEQARLALENAKRELEAANQARIAAALAQQQAEGRARQVAKPLTVYDALGQIPLGGKVRDGARVERNIKKVLKFGKKKKMGK